MDLKKLKANSDDCQCEISICNTNPVNGLNLIDVSYYRQGVKCHLSEFKEERFRGILTLPKVPRDVKNVFGAVADTSADANFLKISNSDQYSLLTELEFCLAEEEGDGWGYRLRDHLVSAHLWSVYTTQEWTDVHLCMSKNVFLAHRAVLCARSPVFASIIKANVNEMKVDVEDVEPELFEDFLFFLYTGTVRNSENLADLWPLAQKYGVKTLEKISQFA